MTLRGLLKMTRVCFFLYFIIKTKKPLTNPTNELNLLTLLTLATLATHATHATHKLPLTLSTSSRTLTTKALNLLTNPTLNIYIQYFANFTCFLWYHGRRVCVDVTLLV